MTGHLFGGSLAQDTNAETERNIDGNWNGTYNGVR